MKHRRGISARVLWLLLILLAALFFTAFVRTEMFPVKWKLIVLAVLVLIVILTGLLSIKFWHNGFVKFLDILLCLFLGISSVLLPRYTDKISSLFDKVTSAEVKISLYTLNSSYRTAHPELNLNPDPSHDLADYGEAVFLTSMNTDSENQTYAMDQVNELLGDVETLDCSSVYEEAENLYNGSGHVAVISETMLGMVEESYPDFISDTMVLKTYTRKIKSSLFKSDQSLAEEPFILFFGGNDEEGDLSTVGRTDVDMLLAVNPDTGQMAMVSMPRDSYVENPACDNAGDKLTHLGLYGIDNTLKGLEQTLNIDGIDNYVLVNFTTYKEIIDALGGVDVNNDVAFTAIDGEYFPAGEIHLEGEYALMYVRERKAFTDGDFERNYHQQLVMQGIIDKLTSPSVLTKFDSLLDSLQGTFLTSLSSDSIYALAKRQLDENISWNIVKYRVGGETGEEICASAPDQYLSIVYPDEDQITFVSQVIQSVLDGETVVQEDMPE